MLTAVTSSSQPSEQPKSTSMITENLTSEDLLSVPLASMISTSSKDKAFAQKFPRLSTSTLSNAENEANNEFLVNERAYSQQYAGIYFCRLSVLRPNILEKASRIWASANAPHISRVLDVQLGQVCFVVGTIYADLTMKPNILDEVTAEHWAVVPPPRPKYTGGEKDSFLVEDESGRILLTGDVLKTHMLVTGIVVGVLGREIAGGEFEVLDICYPTLSKQKPLPSLNEDRYIALASGLLVGSDSSFDLPVQLMVDYLTGELGCASDQSLNSKVVKLILAGNSLAKPVLKEDDRGKSKKYSEIDVTPLLHFDAVLSSLCSTIPTDVMPGDSDPAGLSLPQQPIHSSMFPKANCYDSLSCVTNPYVTEIDGVSVMGSSGQNLDDIYKYVDSEDRLAMAEANLKWGHLAPTAPDTLWCYPFKDTDPFIMQSNPHLYFIGNQPEFETSLVGGPAGEKTRIVLVPNFKASKSFVLVNLRTLEATEVSFHVEF